MKETPLKLLKEKYQYLSYEFDIEKIGVFGSTVKEIEKEVSDIDIVVEFKKPIGLKFIELVEFLENLFNRKVDLLTPAGIENIRIRKISEEIKRNIIYV